LRTYCTGPTSQPKALKTGPWKAYAKPKEPLNSEIMKNKREYREGDEVEIVNVSNGQHHNKMGDGHETFVGLTGIVQGQPNSGMVHVFMPTMDYALGFIEDDLELVKPAEISNATEH
jgi:ribosomal protein L21E